MSKSRKARLRSTTRIPKASADKAPAAKSGMDAEGLEKYRAELIGKRADIVRGLQQLQAQGNQLAAELNKVTGELAAVERIKGV